MKRYCHFLKSLPNMQWSSIVLCVEVSSRLIEIKGKKRKRIEDMQQWCITALATRRRHCDVTKMYTGEDVDVFWTTMLRLVDPDRRVHVVSCNCTRVWSLLHLWEEIDDGRISIGNPRTRTPEDDDSVVCSVPQETSTCQTADEGTGMQHLHNPLAGFMVIEDPPNIAHLTLMRTNASMVWWDIRNWGATINHVSGTDANNLQSVSQWYRATFAMFTSASLGPPSITAGCWAMAAFRHKFYEGGIYMNTHTEACKLEEAAYYGGRCECFRLGKQYGKGRMLDIRSCYLAICAWNKLPVGLIKYYREDECIGNVFRLIGDGAIADVTVNTSVPVSPMRRHRDIIYPIGKFRTVLCGPELSMVIHNGEILKVHGLALYNMSHALCNWAKGMYAMRELAERENNHAAVAAIKTAGLALVGKLGQRNRRWNRFPGGDGNIWYGEPYGKTPNGDICKFRYIGGICFIDEDQGFAYNANTAMAAWVTSAAREMLWIMIMAAGRQNVWYCDTDAIIVSEEGYCNILNRQLFREKELGFMSLKEGPDEVEIWGIKHYRIGNHVVYAGLPRGVITESDDGLHHWYTESSVAQMQDGESPAATAYKIMSQSSGYYQHGVINDDGSVSPISYGGDDK